MATNEQLSSSKATQDQILQAAEKLFAEKGFEKTTLKDVAQEAGANHALVGYYFGNKMGLQKEVLRIQIDRLNRVIHPIVSQAVPGDEVVRKVFKTVCDLLDSSPYFYRIILWSLAEQGALMEDVVKNMWDPMVKNFEHLVLLGGGPSEPTEKKARAIVMMGVLMQYNRLRWSLFEQLKGNGGSSLMLGIARKLMEDQFLATSK